MKRGLWLLLVAALAAGCARSSPSPCPTDMPAATVLSRAAETMASVQSFHLDLTHPKGSTPIPGGLAMTRASADMVKPGSLKATLDATVGAFFVQIEVVIIGDTTYLQDPVSRRWNVTEGEASPLAFLDPEEGITQIMSSLEGLTRSPGVTEDGVRMCRISGTLPASALEPIVGNVESDAVVKAEVWIGAEDFLLRRARVTGRIIPGEPEDVVRVLELSGFDQPVTIQPPR